MLIPHDQLQPDTLLAVIEEFISRDGAVHGHQDTPLDEMVKAVRRQLECGEVVIVFNEDDETCTLVPKEQWELAASQSSP